MEEEAVAAVAAEEAEVAAEQPEAEAAEAEVAREAEVAAPRPSSLDRSSRPPGAQSAWCASRSGPGEWRSRRSAFRSGPWPVRLHRRLRRRLRAGSPRPRRVQTADRSARLAAGCPSTRHHPPRSSRLPCHIALRVRTRLARRDRALNPAAVAARRSHRARDALPSLRTRVAAAATLDLGRAALTSVRARSGPGSRCAILDRGPCDARGSAPSRISDRRATRTSSGCSGPTTPPRARSHDHGRPARASESARRRLRLAPSTATSISCSSSERSSSRLTPAVRTRVTRGMPSPSAP